MVSVCNNYCLSSRCGRLVWDEQQFVVRQTNPSDCLIRRWSTRTAVISSSRRLFKAICQHSFESELSNFSNCRDESLGWTTECDRRETVCSFSNECVIGVRWAEQQVDAGVSLHANFPFGPNKPTLMNKPRLRI